MSTFSDDLEESMKPPLPPNWEERISKKHPDKPYYYNKKTKKSSWLPPVDKSGEDKFEGHKSLNGSTSNEDGAFSDCYESSSSMVINPYNKNNKNSSKSSISCTKGNDTPAMKAVRERIEAKKINSKKTHLNKNLKLCPSKKCRSSSTSSQASNTSAISDVSSLGSKIRAAAIPRSSIINGTDPKINKLPKIKKINQSNKQQLIQEKNIKSRGKIETILTDNDSLKKSLKRNCASERLENLRKRLSTDNESTPHVKRTRLSLPQENNNDCEFAEEISKLLNQPETTLKSNAHARLCSIENRIQKNTLLQLTKNYKSDIDPEEIDISKRLAEKIHKNESFMEDMDWEPIEDEKIMSEVHLVRSELVGKPNENASELPSNTLQSINCPEQKSSLYIVVDTNVFLSNLSFIEEILDSNSEKFGRPFIVIPWTVIEELDYIKENKNRSHQLRSQARKAVDLLNKHFSSKHPRFLGQTPEDVQRNNQKFEIDCPDDRILQTCLQVRDYSRSVVLLSYDKNLCNKALLHNIPTLSRDEPLDKIELKTSPENDFLANSLHCFLETEQNDDCHSVQKELLEAEDIMEEGKALLKKVLDETISKEMNILFGDGWESHVIIRPPWSVIDALKCALKHWMAAVSESFTRKTESTLKELFDCLKIIPTGGRKLKDVQFFLGKCEDMFQTISSSKYPVLKPQMIKKIDELKHRCHESINNFNETRFKNSVGEELAENQQNVRADLAFRILEEIYDYARDTCGIASSFYGIKVSFEYKEKHPFITTKIAVEQQKDVGINVNKLLSALEKALAYENEGLLINDRVILTLFEVLLQFSSDLNIEDLRLLTPLDVYYCVKLKKDKLEKGRDQLQTLKLHFCQIANAQCKTYK
ncbi:transcriptional protein SWT1-like [Trichogramma pretiosum]|uniref:transcriptional protein SWT1-like n=1 Tax=Trichogramma pretiosum TaxID=7493 RepID=UPI0006C98652|nr:transcriptional protein SWT1-like [Trichogramma pretiosum]